MRTYQVTLEGVTPLMMHRDNLEFNSIVEKWQRDPANRDKSIPGDDRSPAWNWIGLRPGTDPSCWVLIVKRGEAR